MLKLREHHEQFELDPNERLTVQLNAAQRDFFAKATKIMIAKRQNAARRLFFQLYPDEDTHLEDGTTLFARDKYQKHLEFFEAGAKYRERAAICANRIGKTFGIGGYETTAHLTGEYPEWWVGKRFNRPIKAWAAGKTNETTRDIVQETLMGELLQGPGGRRMVSGTGLIPGHLIAKPNFKSGLPDLIDTVRIKHKSGGWSTLGFKSFQQGRGSFEGTAQHVIWMDEEVPEDIYGECVIRTATTHGITMLTFTPIEGLTNVAASFMPGNMGDED